MTVQTRSLLPLLLAILLLAGPVAGRSATVDEKLRARLDSAAAGAKLPVIVSLADKISPAAFRSVSTRQDRNALVGSLRRKAAGTQAPVKDFLRNRGVGKIDSLWIVNALSIEAEPELIETLALRPEVLEIRLNGTVTAPEVEVQQVAGEPEWNIAAVGADLLWEMGLTGEGVVVATLDSGVDGNHPDLQSKWRGWTGAPCDPETGRGTGNWFDPHGEHPNCPADAVGHGTNVMGVLVGGAAGGTSIGVAPDAAWIAAKIFDDAGNSTYAAIHRAFQWALDPDGNGDTGDAPDIVNNSWGLNDAMNSCLNEFQSDIALLKAAGIAVLFSAGNTGPELSTSISPANYPETLGVGSTDRLGAVAESSARGPSPCASGDSIYPDLTAPGEHVRTTGLTEGGAVLDSYVITFGTSISVSQVSGIMALLLETDGFPLTSVPELETALRLSATDLGPEGPDNHFGYGQVNALAAYKRLAGLPYLGVYDPDSPEHDLALDFGSIPVGLEVIHPIVIRNSGGGQLLPNIVTLPEQPFSVVGDTCSGTALAAAASCRIDLRFSPAADISHIGNLTVSSNDTDRGTAVISLAGTGNSDPLPPVIEFSAAGQSLAFGSVVPGSTIEKSLTITNAGVEFLEIGPLDSSLLPPQFKVAADRCGGKSLAGGASCEMVFSFSPDAVRTYQGSVEINSNDPVQASTIFTLTGVGNHPPARATLVSPPNGATDLALPVTVQWLHPGDPDGDPVTDTVVVAELRPGTAGAGTANPMLFTAAAMPVLAWILLLLAAALIPGYLGKTRRRSACFVILAGGILLLNSCGGGSDPPATPASVFESLTETELKSGTTYTWKVVSEDGKGGVSESASWSFTTR